MSSFPISGHLTAKVPPERMLAAARRGGGKRENQGIGPVGVLFVSIGACTSPDTPLQCLQTVRNGYEWWTDGGHIMLVGYNICHVSAMAGAVKNHNDGTLLRCCNDEVQNAG